MSKINMETQHKIEQLTKHYYKELEHYILKLSKNKNDNSVTIQ